MGREAPTNTQSSAQWEARKSQLGQRKPPFRSSNGSSVISSVHRFEGGGCLEGRWISWLVLISSQLYQERPEFPPNPPPPHCRLVTSKIILERGKEVADDRDTPRPSEQLLATTTAHVVQVCVVERKAKDPGKGEEREAERLAQPFQGKASSPTVVREDSRRDPR